MSDTLVIQSGRMSFDRKANKRNAVFILGWRKAIEKFLSSRKMGKVWKFGLISTGPNIPHQSDRFWGNGHWEELMVESRIKTNAWKLL